MIFLHRGSECALRALLNLSKQAQFSEAGVFKLSGKNSTLQAGADGVTVLGLHVPVWKRFSFKKRSNLLTMLLIKWSHRGVCLHEWYYVNYFLGRSAVWIFEMLAWLENHLCELRARQSFQRLSCNTPMIKTRSSSSSGNHVKKFNENCKTRQIEDSQTGVRRYQVALVCPQLLLCAVASSDPSLDSRHDPVNSEREAVSLQGKWEFSLF